MPDLSEAVKSRLLILMEGSVAVTVIVPAQRIFLMQPKALPSYPFIRYGSQNLRPYEDTCGAGVDMSVTIHAFGRSEDETQKIAAAIQSAVDDADGFWQSSQTGHQNQRLNALHDRVGFVAVSHHATTLIGVEQERNSVSLSDLGCITVINVSDFSILRK